MIISVPNSYQVAGADKGAMPYVLLVLHWNSLTKPREIKPLKLW